MTPGAAIPFRRLAPLPSRFQATCWGLAAIPAATLFRTTYVHLLDLRSTPLLVACGIATGVGFAATIVALLVARHAVVFLFVFFATQPIVQVFLDIIVLGNDPLWHFYFPRLRIEETLSFLFVLANVTYLFVLASLAHDPADPAPRPPEATSPAATLFAWVFCGGLALILLHTGLTVSRDAFMQQTAGGERFFVVLGMLAIAAGVAWGFSTRGGPMRALGVFCLVIGIAIAFAGFRSVLVGVAVTAGAIYLRNNRVTPLRALGAVALLFCAYYFMAFLNFLRNADVSLGTLLSGAVRIDSFKDALVFAGRAEQIELYSVAYARTLDSYYGLTYLFSALRVLPNFIGEGMLAAQRPQDILVLGGPYAFVEAGLNLGAYFFAEASLNFGIVGVAVVTVITLALLIRVERARESSGFMRLAYPILAGMMPTLAIYGSANFFKQTLTLLALTAVFHLLARVRWRVPPRNPLAAGSMA